MPLESFIPIENILDAAPVTETFELIEQVARQLDTIQRHTVKEANLTPPQYQTLRLLWAQDRRALKELAALNGCTPPTMTGIVDTLEKKDLVARKPNPADRRSSLVALTEKGKALEGTTPNLDRMYAHCCVGLSSNEFRQLSVLLKKLHESLDCT